MEPTNEYSGAVMRHWIETGEPATIKTIAKLAARAESTVRRALDKRGGAPEGCDFTDFYVEKRSRDYPMFGAGSQKATAFLPSRGWLREIIARLCKADEAAPVCSHCRQTVSEINEYDRCRDCS